MSNAPCHWARRRVFADASPVNAGAAQPGSGEHARALPEAGAPGNDSRLRRREDVEIARECRQHV